MPGGELFGSGTDHVMAKIGHQPHFLDQGQELIGRQKPTERVLPTGQGLEARNLARVERTTG